MIGSTISHYRVLEKLGAGGMGVVYKAEDTRLGRFVTLKLLSDAVARDPRALERFRREARTVSALNHPNICALYDIGEVEGNPYMVMEYLQGTNLRELIETRTLDVHAFLDLAIEIVDGLQAAHAVGIIHRDIKPANIFITKDGHAKILDFGLAKITSITALPGESVPVDHMSTVGGALGTAAYMSPEQALGKPLDARTDIFSFGVSLYEVATGTMPFCGETTGTLLLSIVQQVPVAPVQLNSTIPKRLEAVINKCLEKDRELRYRHALDVRSDLVQVKRESGREKVAFSSKIRTGLASSSVPAEPWLSRKVHWHRYWSYGAVAAVVILAVIAGSVYWHSHRPIKLTNQVKLTNQDTIVLADFANATGDAVFDDTLKTALGISLRQSPFLNVLPESRVVATLQLMERSADTKLTSAVVRDLCQRADCKAYIAGTITSLGKAYVLSIAAVNCDNGDTLAQEQVTAPSKEKVLDALGTAASKLRGELGESLATLQKFDVPLQQATTSSLEALKAYSLGEKQRNEKGPASGLPYMQNAIKLDPNFAMAYEELGAEYSALGEAERSSEYITRALQLRQHASEREKLVISARYYRDVTGEVDRAERAYQELIENYPRAVTGYNNIGTMYGREGQYEKAAEWMRKAQKVDPTNAAPYGNLCYYQLALQQFDQALQTIHESQARKFDGSIYHDVLYALAFLKGETSAMAEQQKWFAGNPAMATYGLALASDTEAFAGHLRKARELTNASVDSAINADNQEIGAVWWENAALREAAFGNYREARRAAANGLKLSPASPSVRVEAALAFAMSRDIAQSESIADGINKGYPSGTQVQSVWLPAIEAQIALDRKHPAVALKDIRNALPPIEYANLVFLNNLTCLYTAYIRGEANLTIGDGKAAAAEFQKILDHSGLVWNCWTGALAHLGLARGNALQASTSHGTEADGARLRALAAYKDFLTLWKDADPDIPILKQGKAEYQKLH